MKIIKKIVATLMIIVLIGLSSVGIFGLASTDVDNKKVDVALVNEDMGSMIQGKEIRYGDDFVKLFVQNKDANYEVTTRSSAQSGINNGKYDLMIVVPKTFTQKALTYDTDEPEHAYLEYAKSNKLSQTDAFKADLVSRILKETANKTLIKTFTLNILKTMQDMQKKSLTIIDNEMNYQKKYKENVEKPMADAMSEFDSRLSEISSQQGMLHGFDSYVKGFDSSVKNQTEKEKQNLANFEAQRKKAEEVTEEFTKWSTDYESILKTINNDTYRKTFIDLQKSGALTLQDSIDNLKLNAVRVELYKKRLEEDKKEYEGLKKSYSAVFSTGIYNRSDTTLTPKAKKNLVDLQNKINNLVGNKKSSFYIQTQKDIEEIKTRFETKLAETCSLLPNNSEAYPAKDRDYVVKQLKPFCKKLGAQFKDVVIEPTKVEYVQIIKLDPQTINATVSAKNAKARYRFAGENDTKWVNTFPKTNPTKAVIEMEISGQPQMVRDSENIKPMQVDLTISQNPNSSTKMIVMIPGEIQDKNRQQQKETVDAMLQLDTLTAVYYGKDIKTLSKEVSSNQPITFKNLRGLGTEKSLVVKLNNLVANNDGNELKKEIMKMLAEELVKQTDEYIKKITIYIDEIQKISNGALVDESKLGAGGIYKTDKPGELKEPKVEYYVDHKLDEKTPKTSLNYVIAKMTEQQSQIKVLADNLTAFDNQFNEWMKQHEAISDKVAKIVELRKEEGKISVELEKNQTEILKSATDLQKSITSQLKYSESVIKDSDKIKKSSEDSVKKIKANAAKLEKTKKAFDKTVSGNSDLVKDFVRKYASAQSGGADNQLFYQNIANPVTVKETATSNSNNLTSFFTILMISLFALVIARFFNEYRRGFIARKLKSEHGVDNVFAGVTLELGLVTIASIISAIAVSFIGLQAIVDSVSIDKVLVYTIVGVTLVALAYAFSVILLGFKKYGTHIILAFIALYFLTNGALGLAIVKNDSFSWLRGINPLGYIENILQSVFLTQVAPIQALLIGLGVVMIVSVASIYFLQPLMYKQKESK